MGLLIRPSRSLIIISLYSLFIWGCEDRLSGENTSDYDVFSRERDSVAVREVLQGLRSSANAAWWGFNDTNATKGLQSAINSGAKRLYVPDMGKPWLIDPVNLASHQEIIFQGGAILLAKKGSYRGVRDAMLTANGKEDLTLWGYGAKLVMRRADYESPPYLPSEWRHTLALLGCRNVSVYGLQLTSSGGDGIYVGRGDHSALCENIAFSEILCDSNHRQGISVISAKNLSIQNSAFNNTKGTPPEAGIDFEPNYPDECLSNCNIRNTVFRGNNFYGIVISPHNLDDSSIPISIFIDSCQSQQNVQGALCVWGTKGATKSQGTIKIKSTILNGNRWYIDVDHLAIEFL
jgi:hypothetical protein